jgi:hypothetical protein
MSMLAPGRSEAQFLTANRNAQVHGGTRSYDLRFRRATADPSYVVYVSRRRELAYSAMLADCKMPQGSLGLQGKIKRTT